MTRYPFDELINSLRKVEKNVINISSRGETNSETYGVYARHSCWSTLIRTKWDYASYIEVWIVDEHQRTARISYFQKQKQMKMAQWITWMDSITHLGRNLFPLHRRRKIAFGLTENCDCWSAAGRLRYSGHVEIHLRQALIWHHCWCLLNNCYYIHVRNDIGKRIKYLHFFLLHSAAIMNW